MKTVLVRAYSAENLGDDLFLKVLFERYPNVNFLFISSNLYKKKLKKIYKNVSVIIPPNNVFINRIINKIFSVFFNRQKAENYMLSKYNHFLKKIVKKTDGYIYIGGSLFMESNFCISFEEKLNQTFTKIYNDKPKFIIGANFGPFKHKEFLEYYREIFRNYDDICFRDEVSYSYFKDLPNTRFETDIVFQLSPFKTPKIVDSVGISMINLAVRPSLKQFHNSYLETIKLIIEYYLNDGKKIFLYSFCKKEGDEQVIKEITHIFSNEQRKNIEVIYYNGKINDFLSLYMSMEIVFPTRFHGMILSFIAQQKICPIIYSDKMSFILCDLNYSGKMLDITKINSVNIQDICKEIKSFSFNIEQSMFSANMQFKEIDSFLLI